MDNTFGPFGSESAYLFHEMLKQVELGPDGGRKVFEKGEVIFHEGKHPVGLFCMITGKAKVFRLNEDGREQIVRLHGPNEIMGYKSLVMESPYHATAVAVENCSVGFISKSSFDYLIETNPRISRLFMKILCHNLDQSEDFMVSLASKNIREKVAGALIFLYDKFGVDFDNTLKINLSREEIAGMIGVATENLSRAITQLKEEGIIETLGRKIAIKNEPLLRDIRGEI
ncbi:cyclic nucleotide-binding domain-containing protein [bacterium]|nr:cyclic nucleotide-binding domain-containing protein [bacterium]